MSPVGENRRSTQRGPEASTAEPGDAPFLGDVVPIDRGGFAFMLLVDQAVTCQRTLFMKQREAPGLELRSLVHTGTHAGRVPGARCSDKCYIDITSLYTNCFYPPLRSSTQRS